jgi:hypothetical protein
VEFALDTFEKRDHVEVVLKRIVKTSLNIAEAVVSSIVNH